MNFVPDIDECSIVSTLYLNNGTCVNTFGGFECTCTGGYKGSVCNTEPDEVLNQERDENSNSSNDVALSVGVSIGLVILVTVLVIGTFITCKKIRNTRKGTLY